ncbi:MAG: hypothetical protein NZ921_05065 [Candidatus Caldarchaeum sp.]|nr:hypothetical protein [Candidatus Caldarchaeum sp.]
MEKRVALQPMFLTDLIQKNKAFIRFLVKKFGVYHAQKYLDSFQSEYYQTFFEDIVRGERPSKSVKLNEVFHGRLDSTIGKLDLFYTNFLFSVPLKKIMVMLPLIKIGVSTVSFSVYTYTIPGGQPKDPINLVFWRQARPGNLRDIMMNYLTPPWRNTNLFGLSCAETQYIYLENRDGAGSWVAMRYSLSPEGCRISRRIHIRLFDGGFDDKSGYLSIGAVHEEDFSIESLLKDMTPHKVTDWDKAQLYVESQFRTLNHITGSVRHVQLQRPNEVIQGVNNDGEASFIEIL